jgi:endo-alpha-1,4-polygalactosaminidase (GH114 family)
MAATEISMELIYSTQSSGFDPDKRYRNPEHFDRPEAGVTGVVVVGEWPKVVEAYERVGVEVTAIKAESRQVLVVEAGDNTAELEALVGKLRIESDMVRAVIDGLDAGEIEKPEVGELAIRLFHSLDGLRGQMVELAGARDAEAERASSLKNQVDDLLAQAAQARLETDETKEAKEITELKAKLDTFSVPYRANASKESLEKLVAELPKA